MNIATSQPLVATSAGLRVIGESSDTSPALDGVITSVSADGDDVWALVDGRDLHRVTADSSERVASLDDGPAGVCVGVHQGTVWVGGDDAALWRLDGDVGAARLVASATWPDAPTRDDWHTPWGGPPSVYSIAAHGDDLYVSVHVGGILRTSDGGESWTPTIDLHVDVHEVTVDADGTLWAATGAGGLATSSDRGATWQHHTSGLHGTYLLAVAVADDGVLVSASSGPHATDGKIYRFDGAAFTSSNGLPEDLDGAVGPRQLAASGTDAAVALPNGDVYTSTDRGTTWQRVASSLPAITEVTLPTR